MPYRDSRTTPRKQPKPEGSGSKSYLHADQKPDSDPQFTFTPQKPKPKSGSNENKALLIKNLVKLAKATAFMGLTLFVAMKVTTFLWSRDQPSVKPLQAPVTDAEPTRVESFAPDESGSSTRPAINMETVRMATSYVDDGRELQGQGEARAALRSYQQAIRMWPEVPDALYLMGAVYLELDEFERAEHSLRQALLLSPDNAVVLDQLGLSLLRQGKGKEAHDFFQRALVVDASLGSAQLNLSLALLALGQPRAAHTLLERYVDKHPTDVTALHGLALVAATENRKQEALPYLEKAILLAPDQPELYFEAAATSALIGKDAEALDYLEQAETISTPAEVYKAFKQKAFKQLRAKDSGKAYEAALIQRAREYERSIVEHAEPVLPVTGSLSLE